MSGIAGSEVVLLIIIGLVVLGPKRLPQVANQIGSWLGQARRMTRMMKRQLEEEVNFDINSGLSLNPNTAAKQTGDVSSPEYVNEPARKKAAGSPPTETADGGATKNADDLSPAESAQEPVAEKTGSDAEAELPDDYSPAHDADAPGTGVGDEADYDEAEPAATAAADPGETDTPVNADIAEPEKKESA